MTAYIRGSLLTPKGLLCDQILEISGGRIARITVASQSKPPAPVLRLGGGILVPGFIDLQVNPVGNYDLARKGADAIPRLAAKLSCEGTTGFLISLISCDFQTLKVQMAAAGPWVKRPTGGAQLLGLHLEGPFLNPARHGVHPLAHLKRPTTARVSAILEAAGSSLRMMTVAPEVPGGMALVRRLDKERIVASIGHSNATYDQALMAIDAGARSATHLFNASSPFHHRAPGVVGAVLERGRVTAQIIPDGVHVHPSCVDLVYHRKGKGGMAVATDSLAGGVRQFHFAGQKIEKRNGKFRAADGRLAGSTLTMAGAFANLQRFVKAPLEDLVECLSLTPATLLGLGQRKGSLEVGKEADLVWLDEEGRVAATWVKGEQVYVRDHRLHR